MNLTKLFGALSLASFAILAGCAAQTSDAATEETASTQDSLRAPSCTGLDTATCEATRGCMEQTEGCVVSCSPSGGCVTKCNTACVPLDCSALANSECDTYAGTQCQLAKSCLVTCHPGTGCTTTCHNSCQPTTVNCAALSVTQCEANASRCQVNKGACLVSCTLGSGCVTKCGPSTCGDITE
jgi:hypothetical protein